MRLYWRKGNKFYHCYKKQGKEYVSLCRISTIQNIGGQKLNRPEKLLRCLHCNFEELDMRKADWLPATVRALEEERIPQPIEVKDYLKYAGDSVLSLDGKFYYAPSWTHEKVAEMATGKFWDDLKRKGWLRLSGGTVYFAFGYRKIPTQAQFDALYDYAEAQNISIIELFDDFHSKDKAREYLGI